MTRTFIACVRLCPVSNSNTFCFLGLFVKVIINNGYFITALVTTVFNSKGVTNGTVSHFSILISILKACHTYISFYYSHNGST